MHEFSTMQGIVNAILEEAKKYRAIKIYRVEIEIGELTFLGKEQMKFAFDILKENTIMEDAKISIKKKKARVKCIKCGYEGGVEYGMKDDFHITFPIIRCPKCGGEVEIVKGRECLIKNVEMEIEDVAVER